MSKFKRFKKAAFWTADKTVEAGVNLILPGDWGTPERIKDEDEPANGEGDSAVDESWEPPEPDSLK